MTKPNNKNLMIICEPIKTMDKVKAKKITKEDKEKEVIAEFEKHSNDIFETGINFALKLDEIKCKKIDFETFSEGLIRMHKRSVHQLMESNLNVMLGLKSDITHHIRGLKAMDELNKIACLTCDFSKGELKIHDQEQHN